jgi:hypothetical protein
VHRPALEALGLVPADTVAAHARSPELWWDPVRGGGWALDPVPVAVVARVRWVAGSTTRMTDLKASEGLRVLLDNVLQGGLKPAESLDRMVAMVESAVSVDLRFGSAADGARALAGRAKGREGP